MARLEPVIHQTAARCEDQDNRLESHYLMHIDNTGSKFVGSHQDQH